MWLLKKLDQDATKYLISEKHCYTVGRRNCDFTIEDDPSLSRKHCSIYVAKKNDCPFNVTTTTGIWIVDEQSKYGTYVKNNNEWVKLIPNQNQRLKDGCVIRFGLMENVWRLEYKPIMACTSGVQADQKKEIENLLKQLDSELKNVWSRDCSLVIVNEITLTVKVVLALINGIPIVTPAYLKKLLECVKNQAALPDYNDYKPSIKENMLDASLVSLDAKNNRKELFKGKKFVIPTKRQLETLKEVILCAGGKVELLSYGGNWERYAEENTIVIQMPLNNAAVPEEQVNSFKEISLFLKNKHDRRVVPESEIAQAVAYSSIEKYCNPKSTCFELKRSNKEPELGILIAEETPDATEKCIPDPCIVPCSMTIDSQYGDNMSKNLSQKSVPERKRTHSPDEFDVEVAKRRPRTENVSGFDESQSLEALSLADKNALPTERKKTDKKQHKENQTKTQKGSTSGSSFITSYFKKVDKTTEKSSEGAQEFWNLEPSVSNPHKRKLMDDDGDDDDSVVENSPPKKSRFFENDTEHPVTSKSNQSNLSVIDNNKTSDHRDPVSQLIEKPSTPVQHYSGIRDDCLDFENFIEKERRFVPCSEAEDLNNTIYSVTIISRAYLKEDGSLIEPPTVPVNVKKFRKQRVQSVRNSNFSNQAEEEISGGDWLEPHPPRLCMRMNDEENW